MTRDQVGIHVLFRLRLHYLYPFYGAEIGNF